MTATIDHVAIYVHDLATVRGFYRGAARGAAVADPGRGVPTMVLATGLVLGMAGLAYSMRTLPTGTAYAVWVGIGATLTLVYAMLTEQEFFSEFKALFLAFIVGGVVGLKVLH